MAPSERKSCLPIVKNGCCCCTLRTCCLVQGWLALICTAGTIVQEGFSFVGWDPAYNQSKQIWKVDNATIIRFIIVVVVQVVTLVTAALFLNGIFKNKPRRMLPFIYMLWINVVVWSLALILTAFVNPVILVGFVFLALPIYCIICANSLRIEMTDAQAIPQYNTVSQKA